MRRSARSSTRPHSTRTARWRTGVWQSRTAHTSTTRWYRPDRAKAAWAALKLAREKAKTASEADQALIDALEARYADPLPDDRRKLDEAYAEAMKAVWEKFPKDADIGALYAESLMNLRPWDLWTVDGKPQPETPEIIATLEAVLELNPNHPLALPPVHPRVSRRRRIRRRRTRPRTGSAPPAGAGPHGAHAVAHRHPPRPVADGDRGERAGHHRRQELRGRPFPSRGSTACTWPTTTTCWRSPR